MSPELSTAFSEWQKLCSDLVIQGFHHLVGPMGSVQMQGFEEGWGKQTLTAVPMPLRRQLMEGTMFLLKASNNQRLFARKAELEDILSKAFPCEELIERLLNVSYEAVAGTLDEETIFIEYIRTVGSWTFSDDGPVLGGDAYYAIVLSGNRNETPRLECLGYCEEIDRAITEFRLAITGTLGNNGAPLKWVTLTDPDDRAEPPRSPDDDLAAAYGKNLRERLLDPLFKPAKQRSRLIIAPDGLVAAVPFQCLPTSDGTTIIDYCQVTYVNTGRDLLNVVDAPQKLSNRAVVVADPDFDLSEDATIPAYDADPVGPHQSPRAASVSFSSLLESRREGVEIAALLNSELYLGADATVSAIKASNSPDVLHVATHGFFLLVPQNKPAPT